ncbi:MAG: DUF294 nucleotidyltransferase-like domain-containing protein [Thermodesulfovibrionales bacterium]|nr:DUF294 nucleotidyltransferase-like domain-containing protein [Thermodesulfovibrionales bacterium]
MYNILEEVISFLKKVPPFQFLDDETLSSITEDVSMDFYPKGTTIVYQDGPLGDYIRVIKRGAVKVTVGFSEAEEVVIDYREDGELIGYLALLNSSKSRANVIAIEDTVCYLLRVDVIADLMKTNPQVNEFFQKSFLNKFLDKAYKELHSKNRPYNIGWNLLYTTSIEEVGTKKVITAPQDISIRDAAKIMSENRISSVVLVNSDNMPVGIITDRDLREKVVAKGRNFDSSAKDIMSLPFLRVDAQETLFEALLKMIKHNVHHLPIVKDGVVSGIITNHDVILFQGTSPITLAKDIENQKDIEGLAPLARRVENIVSLLLNENLRAMNIGRVIAEINDRIIGKVLELAELKLGKPPVPYCWIVFGSEGRKEQAYKTDQDNAIIYKDTNSNGEDTDVRKYFAEFTSFVAQQLFKCGFPPCPVNYTASNPRLCQPLKVWKKNFGNWILELRNDSIINSPIFFDFRPVFGDFNLAYELRDEINYYLREQRVFFGYMANKAVRNMPPLGFLKTFVVEKSGEYKDKLNLKTKGIAPIVDMVRLFALEKQIDEVSTLDRIDALKDKHQIVAEYADELLHSLEFLMTLRLQNQFEQIKRKALVDNFIDPDNLTNLEKKTIKEAFQVISSVQDLLIERYKSMIL